MQKTISRISFITDIRSEAVRFACVANCVEQ